VANEEYEIEDWKTAYALVKTPEEREKALRDYEAAKMRNAALRENARLQHAVAKSEARHHAIKAKRDKFSIAAGNIGRRVKTFWLNIILLNKYNKENNMGVVYEEDLVMDKDGNLRDKNGKLLEKNGVWLDRNLRLKSRKEEESEKQRNIENNKKTTMREEEMLNRRTMLEKFMDAIKALGQRKNSPKANNMSGPQKSR